MLGPTLFPHDQIKMRMLTPFLHMIVKIHMKCPIYLMYLTLLKVQGLHPYPVNWIYCTSIDLNPCAKVFSPKCKTNEENGVIGTFLFIIVILSIFIFMDLITSTHVTNDICPKGRLRKLKLDNPNKIVIGHLNINSIRQKFVFLKEIIGDNVDIFTCF